MSTHTFDSERIFDPNYLPKPEPSCTEDIIAFVRRYLIHPVNPEYNYAFKAGFREWYEPGLVNFCSNLDKYKYCTREQFPQDYQLITEVLEFTKFQCGGDNNDPENCAALAKLESELHFKKC